MLQDYSAVIQAEHVIVAEERREIALPTAAMPCDCGH
jgi:hypothetical protein